MCKYELLHSGRAIRLGNFASYRDGKSPGINYPRCTSPTSCWHIITTYKTQWLLQNDGEQAVITDDTLPHVAWRSILHTVRPQLQQFVSLNLSSDQISRKI